MRKLNQTQIIFNQHITYQHYLQKPLKNKKR